MIWTSRSQRSDPGFDIRTETERTLSLPASRHAPRHAVENPVAGRVFEGVLTVWEVSPCASLSTPSSPSYRAIEAAIGGLSRHKRRGRLISADLSAALVLLLDEESGDVERLEECARLLYAPSRRAAGAGPIDPGVVGRAVVRPRRVGSGQAGARCSGEWVGLLAARCVIDDLAEVVESETRPHISPEKLREQFYELDLPAELMMALARFFMAMAAAACIVVAARMGRRLRGVIAAALVKNLDEGLAALLPWLTLVIPGCLSVATRQRLPRLDFQRIFEEHAAAVTARRQLIAGAGDTTKRAGKAGGRSKDRRKYAAAS